MRQKTIEKIKNELLGEVNNLIENWLISRFDFDKRIKDYIEKHYVVCETSKALIRKEDAIMGKKEIKTKYINGCYEYFTFKQLEEYIYTPYYSPAFKPKKK